MERFADLGRPREGIFCMVLSGLSFVSVNAILRYLGPDLPVAQSAFLRFGFGAIFLLPLLLRAEIPARVWGLFAWRGGGSAKRRHRRGCGLTGRTAVSRQGQMKLGQTKLGQTEQGQR